MATPMDLNVPLCEKDLLLQKIQMAAKLGYGTVAINNIQPNVLVKQKKQDKKRGSSNEKRQDEGFVQKFKKYGGLVQAPESIKIDEKLLKSMKGGISKPPKQITRISTVLHDSTQLHLLSDEMIQKYDLVAVTPTCEKTFGQACKELNIDIITIDVSERVGYKIKRSTVHAALERGVHFELQYTPAIRDETMRRYFISNAQQIVFWCKGKNIILTSGCQKAFEMRGPHDVANLGLLIELTDPQAKDAVTKNCRAALYHSESRRVIKSVMKVENCSNLPEKEKDWILSKCNVDVKRDSENKDDPNEPQRKKAKLDTT